MSPEPELPTPLAVMLAYYDEQTNFVQLWQADQPLTQEAWAALMKAADELWEQCDLENEADADHEDPEAWAIHEDGIGDVLVLVARRQGLTLTRLEAAQIGYSE